MWVRPLRRLQIGTAFLWKQGAFRGLANYELIPSRGKSPSLRIGFGLQGIGTGNPGYFATSEKGWAGSWGTASGYLGVGLRTNEDHGHLLGGFKFTPSRSLWTVGFQNDGHDTHPFVTRSLGGGFTAGAYLIALKSPGLLISYSR